MQRFLMTALVILVACQLSCVDNGVNVQPPKDPRDYTWTVDTLIASPNAIQTEMMDIYATSPQNVYVVGITDWSGVNGNGVMWRYDGTKWSIVNQGFRNISLWSITGFSASDIFAAGGKDTSALVLHFDGSSWTQSILPAQGLFAIAGSSHSDVWAGGWMGAAFHFDGSHWSKIPLAEKLSIRNLAVLNGTTYATAYRVSELFPADSTWWYSLRWNGSTWDTLDSYLEVTGLGLPQNFAAILSVVDGELYSGGGSVFKLMGDKWERIFSGPYAGKVSGPIENRVFSVGFRGTVYYYDGIDWFQFNQFQSDEYSFGSVWFDGREVFVVGDNGERSIVIHGK